MKSIKIIALFFAAVSAASSNLALGSSIEFPGMSEMKPKAAEYYFCSASTQYGKEYYYSSIFSAEKGSFLRKSGFTVGMANSFYKYVSAQHNSGVRADASCSGPFHSQREAEDRMNDDIGDEKERLHSGITMTGWGYSEN